MTMLSAAELTQMRADLVTLLPDTCNILSVSLAPDGQGGMTETWGTAYASVSCRLDPIRGSENVTAANLQDFHAYQLTVPYDTTLTEQNRVVHGGVTYNIVTVGADKSWPISRRARVERT